VALTLRERLKRVQALAIQATGHPLMPLGARALLTETALLLADLVQRIEQLEKGKGE